MNGNQYDQLKTHPGFNILCTACASVALLDPALHFEEAQKFQIEHGKQVGHGVDQTALHPHYIMSKIETIDLNTAVLLKKLTLVTPERFNTTQTRR